MTDEKRAVEKVQPMRQPRTSVTFPLKLYRALEVLAKEKKVSIAWVVREAAEKYVTNPSLRSSNPKGRQS